MKHIQISLEEGHPVLKKIEDIRKAIEKKNAIKSNAGIVKYAILKFKLKMPNWKQIAKEWKETIKNRVLYILGNNTYTILEIINDSSIIYRDVREALEVLYLNRYIEIKITKHNEICISKAGSHSDLDKEWQKHDNIDFSVIPEDLDDYKKKFWIHKSDLHFWKEIDTSSYPKRKNNGEKKKWMKQ